MRVSKHAQDVEIKKTELEILIRKYQEEHGLTDVEVMQALNSYQQSVLKYMLRFERHGDYDTPAMTPVKKD